MAENVTEMTAEQEQEVRAMDEIREKLADLGNTRRIHPGLLAWLAQRERLFASNVRGDLQNAPERHPDVMLLKRLLPQSSFSLHVRLAWICWRARQVRFFHPEHGSRTHVGADVLTWAEALESADERDSVHDEAFAARAAYYSGPRPSREEQRAQSDAEEEAVALTLMRLPTSGRLPTVDIVPTVPPTIGDGKALQQQEISAQKEQERTEEKQLENLRDGKPVNAGVKVRAKNQNQK
jgi:hypothetical protein